MVESASRFLDLRVIDHECLKPVPIILEDHGNVKIFVGCGKCYYCLQKRRKEWFVRNLQELNDPMTKMATFVTLTYNEESLTRNDQGVAVFNKQHLQKFIDRFRKRLFRHHKCHTRYFAVSEYGDKSGRPHYHVLFYHDALVHELAYQDELDASWPFQDIMTDWHFLEPGSISYVCNYVLSYIFSSKHKVERPFLLASRSPAIGFGFLEDSLKVLNALKGDFLQYQVNGFSYRLPRYYVTKMFNEDDNWNRVECYLDNLEDKIRLAKKGYNRRKRIVFVHNHQRLSELKLNQSKHKL